MLAAEKVAAKKTPALVLATEKDDEEKASTSCQGDSYSCWNCGGEMTPRHQCRVPPASNPSPGRSVSVPQVPPAPLPSQGLTPRLEVLSPAAARQRPNPSAPYIIKGKVRNLDGSPLVKPKK